MRECVSPGLVEETHVVGFNPGTVYWMDIFSHIFVVNMFVLMFLCKDQEKTIKEARVCPFKK